MNKAAEFKYLGIVVLISFLALVPFHFGSLTNTEEWHTAFLSNSFFGKALLNGDYPVWVSHLGLGMPFPMEPNQIHHPFVLLFGLMTPGLALSLFYQLQLGVGSIAFWSLCRHYHISRSVALVCVVTYLGCSTTVEWTLLKFLPTEMFYWSMVPLAFLFAAKLLDHPSSERWVTFRMSLFFGLTLGFIVLNSHVTFPVVLSVLLFLFFVVQWREALIRCHWLLLASAVALLISTPKLFMVLNEFFLFPDGLERNAGRLTENRDWMRVSLPHALFILPIFKTDIGEISRAFMHFDLDRVLRILTRDYFAGGAGARLEDRDVFMGPPFVLIWLVAPLLSNAVRNKKIVLFACIAWLSFLLMFLVPDFLLYLVGRDVFFRDGIFLFAILTAGLVLTRSLVQKKRALRICAKWLIVLQLGALLGALAPTWTVLLTGQMPQQPKFETSLSIRDYWGSSSSINRVKEIVGESEARILFGSLPNRTELSISAPAYHGVRQVNVSAKGIYTGNISPSKAAMEGGLSIDKTVVTNSRLLDVLGIRYVIVGVGTTVSPDLEFLENLILQNGETMKILENKDVWPEAVVLDRQVTDKAFGQFPSCMQPGLLCRDFQGIESFRKKGARASLQRQGNTIEVSLANYEVGDLLFVSEMYRQLWTASSDHGRLEVEQIFGGLIGITLPADATKIRFTYTPTMLYGSIGVSYLVVILSLVGIGFSIRRGGRMISPT